MISLTDAYHVVAATVPLYVAMILAYISVKWWKLFTPDQCSGINKFVAKFSIPLLSFQVISTNNPYKMNVRLVCADFLQKLFAFSALVVIMKIKSRGNLSWIITGLSLSTLPNTLILGIPILRAMYGDEAVVLLTQIIVLQSIIWYNVLLFLFEVNMIKQDSLTAPTDGTGTFATFTTNYLCPISYIQQVNSPLSLNETVFQTCYAIYNRTLRNQKIVPTWTNHQSMSPHFTFYYACLLVVNQ